MFPNWIGGHDKHLGHTRAGRHALTQLLRDWWKKDVLNERNGDGHALGPIQKIDVPMRRFGEEEVDYVIVGVGSAGGVLAAALVARRFSRARPGSRTVLGYGARLGQRRSRLAQSLLGRFAHHRRRTHPLALGANNCWPWRWRRFGTLGGLHAAAASIGLSHSLRRRRRHRLADDLRRAETLLRTARAGNAGRGARLLSMGRSARLRLRTASDGRRRRCADPGLHQTRHWRQHRRTGGDSLRFPRRSPALHLSRLLHSGVQGGRQGQHADHACARRAEKWRGDSRQLHGQPHSCEQGKSRHWRQLFRRSAAKSIFKRRRPSSFPAMRSRRRACC